VIEPLRLEFEVACPPEHAFEVWTAQFSRWWPRSHSVSGDANADVILEPRMGGRIFERAPDGTEHDWGQVTRWEPPLRLGYLWHIRRDRSHATDVLVTFEDGGDGTTRLVIEHTGWERLGADAQQWRDANVGGWSSLMPHYVAAAANTGG
jgi:uncharacterized protein YndB with AHSA1/START domain